MADVLRCPLCEWEWHAGMEEWHGPRRLLRQGEYYCDSQEFLVAEHMMGAHMEYREDVSRREVRCFCGQMLSDYIVVVMAHMKQYGGVEEHYRAWQLGVDP